MDDAKIRLSPEEMELVSNAQLILTKNLIIEKIIQFFSAIQGRMQPLLFSHQWLPAEILESSPKISKGENYKGLPWVVLDYPRYFEKENVFAMRTLFWWGNFFSCTLHLSGEYKLMYEKNIINSFDQLKNNGVFICINEEQWQHHFETNNYMSIAGTSSLQFEDAIAKKPFIKLAQKIPIEQWNDVEKKLTAIFSQLINTLKN